MYPTIAKRVLAAMMVCVYVAISAGTYLGEMLHVAAHAIADQGGNHHHHHKMHKHSFGHGDRAFSSAESISDQLLLLGQETRHLIDQSVSQAPLFDQVSEAPCPEAEVPQCSTASHSQVEFHYHHPVLISVIDLLAAIPFGEEENSPLPQKRISLDFHNLDYSKINIECHLTILKIQFNELSSHANNGMPESVWRPPACNKSFVGIG